MTGGVHQKLSFPLCCQKSFRFLDMLLYTTEMDIQLVQVFQKGAKGCAFGHLGKSVDVLGEALTTVTELTVGTGDIGTKVYSLKCKVYSQ